MTKQETRDKQQPAKAERDQDRKAARKRLLHQKREGRKAKSEEAQKALGQSYSTLAWSRMLLPRGKARVELEELPVSILKAFSPHLKRLETGRVDTFTGGALYRYVSYQSGKRDDEKRFVFRGFVASVSNGYGGSAVRVGLTEKSTALAAIMALAAMFDPRLKNLASNTSWLMWLAEGGEAKAAEWLEEVKESINGPTPMPHSGGRPEGESGVRKYDILLPAA